ncbi:MAG: hypothetical protein JW863_01255 [Chitinispirillaceae bacterium]|nr:hypothetical protein [Chitinispirillaceae bacterium]
MNKYMLYCLCISAWLTARPQAITVHGKVLNNVGAPIPFAIVELAGQGLTYTTGSSGSYSFTFSKTAIQTPSLLPTTGRLSLDKGILELRLPGPSPVNINIFDLKGILQKKVLLQDAKAGIYHFTIAEDCRAANLLFITASIGGREITFPYLPLGTDKHTVEFSAEWFSPFTRQLAKTTADDDIDTLKTTAPGCLPNTMAISLNRSDLEVFITLATMNEMLVKSDIPYKSPDITHGQLDSLVRSNTLFAFNLYKGLQTSGDNIFFSPYSISEALAMTYAGAENSTAEQMANTLRFTLPDSIVHAGFDSLDRSLSSETEIAYFLNNANSVWMQKNYTFQKSFLDLLAEYYNTGLYTVDFGNTNLARTAINNWISDMTARRIIDCLPQGALSGLTRMVLVNTLYFKSMWNDTFSVADTRDGTFTNLNSTRRTVPFMHTEMRNQWYYSESAYKAVELMLAGGRTSMVIIMPTGNFEAVENELTANTLDDILSNSTSVTLMLSMPKFSFETESYELSQILSRLGMQKAFMPGSADFSGMTGTRDLYIENVYHKGFFGVNEQGIEAAAGTAVEMGTIGIHQDERITLDIDHPFILFIRDRKTNTVLFMGRITKL